jgi:hypothetical protein
VSKSDVRSVQDVTVQAGVLDSRQLRKIFSTETEEVTADS